MGGIHKKGISTVDVVLIGGGITGLMAAYKLSELGIEVVLIEKQLKLASGTSTRNEGWLHRGTYHASSIKDRSAAIQVAKRGIYGSEQLRHFAPESIEGADIKSLAIIRNRNNFEEVVSRWNEANVKFRHITKKQAQKIIPTAAFEDHAEIFEVDDVSINTRIL